MSIGSEIEPACINKNIYIDSDFKEGNKEIFMEIYGYLWKMNEIGGFLG